MGKLPTDIGLATYFSWIACEDLQYGKEVQLVASLKPFRGQS